MLMHFVTTFAETMLASFEWNKWKYELYNWPNQFNSGVNVCPRPISKLWAIDFESQTCSWALDWSSRRRRRGKLRPAIERVALVAGQSSTELLGHKPRECKKTRLRGVELEINESDLHSLTDEWSTFWCRWSSHSSEAQDSCRLMSWCNPRW